MVSKKQTRWVLLAAAGLLLSGCAPSVKIGKILSDPNRYRDRSVSVHGTVDTSFGALVAGFYEIHDDTGKIYVISSHGGVPSRGANVKVTGRVVSGVTVGGRSFGTAIRESEHKVR